MLITVNLTSIHGIADGLSGFPISLFREEVELPPYQSVLQRLQLPPDCLTFFINSQVIQFPWQQFPADTKNQVSPWKFKSVAGSLGVFICVQLHHHFQEETGVYLSGLSFCFSSPSCIVLHTGHDILLFIPLYHLWPVTAVLQSLWAISVLLKRSSSSQLVSESIGYNVTVI